MIKLATNAQKCKDFEYQLIINEKGFIMGVNLLCENKILIKKRFETLIQISSKSDEQKMVNKLIINAFAEKII